MTKTVITIRHVHFEDLGAFDDVLRHHGYAVRYCDAGIDDIGGVDPLAPDLTVVLGGPDRRLSRIHLSFSRPGARTARAAPHRSSADARHLSWRATDGPSARRAGLSRAEERTRVGCGTAHGNGPKWAIPPFCRGAVSTLARRHFRPPEGCRASRFDRDLPKPGVQLRTPRARLPVPSRNHGQRVRALARRSRRRARCRTRCFARGLAAGHRTPRAEVRVARCRLFVRMARPAA